MKRTACLLPCALLFFAVALPAHAAEDTLTDADLATLRGGFATAGGVTFMGGTMDRMMRAFDSASGDTVWEHQLNAGGFATPCTYEVNGKQYVAMIAGSVVYAFGLGE